MLSFFKKTLKFTCLDNEVSKIYPIIPTSQINFDWKKNLNNECKIDPGKLTTRSFHLCPGINSLHSFGWVIQNNRDVLIKTLPDGNIEWRTNYVGLGDYITFHSVDHFKYFNNWHQGINKNVIKFNTNWFAEIPKGYSLLQMPLIFQDENRFTTISGMYNYKLGIAELNIPVFWNRTTTDETVIKAGTPLAQLLLIKNEKINFEILRSNKKAKYSKLYEKIKLYQYLVTSKFKPNVKKFSEKIK